MNALEGYKILDFRTLLPGPYATMVLGDLGAEVLKVSSKDRFDLVVNWPPKVKGTEVTGAQAWLGRNKKTIFLDLKKPAAVEAVKRLVMDYDIVVEQFRPGVMDRLGIGYEALKAVNPRVIYCAITGYGQTGGFSKRAGHDINYLARSGVAYAAGRKLGGPGLYNFQIADVAGGSMGAVASILAALLYREKTGESQVIDISMQDCVIPFNSMDGASFFAGGPEPARENGLLNGGQIYDFYETSDGGYMSVGSLEPKFFAALCDGLGKPEWRDGKLLRTEEGIREVKNTFREIFRTRSREAWTEIFGKLDACVEPVMSLGEVSRDPHLKSRGMWPEVKVPSAGKETVSVTQMGNPLHLSKCPPRSDHAGYPEGYHTEEVLSALGYSPEEIREMI